MMYDQTGSRIAINNELSVLEYIIMWTNIEKQVCKIIPNTWTSVINMEERNAKRSPEKHQQHMNKY